MNTNNTVKKALSFTKGITNSPSDFVSTDDELTESAGMIMKNGEMVPVQRPAYLYTLGENETFLSVHKGPEYCNHVIFNQKTKELVFYFWNDEKAAIEGEQKITIEANVVNSVGVINNFLIVSTDNSVLYFLFKKNQYTMLGTLPDLQMSFSLVQDGDTLDLLKKKSDAADFKGLTKLSDTYYCRYPYTSIDDYPLKLGRVAQNGNGEWDINDGKSTYKAFVGDVSDDMNKACAGHVAKIQNLAKEKQRFLYPFYVRYAFRLFDGTYARISNPIAVYPSVTRSGYLTPFSWKKNKPDFSQIDDTYLYMLNAPKYELYYSLISQIDWNLWSDIIKEIVVFASDDVPPFRSDCDYEYIANALDSMGLLVSDCVGGSDYILYQKGVNEIEWRYEVKNPQFYARPIFVPKEYKTEKEIIDEMLTKTQFYKIFSIDANKAVSLINDPAPIRTGVLENLTTQEQLPNDDYFGWTKMICDKSYAYNKRLNLIGVKRYPFDGFESFTAGCGSLAVFSFYVHIVSDTIDTWVKKESSFTDIYSANSWFYYPDPNATELIIHNTKNNEKQKINLRRHPFLNGAYAFNFLPNKETFSPGSFDNPFDEVEIELPNVDTNVYERLFSQILTSVVNNPFVFQADGDNTVGTGSVLGITSNTEPISQGQFGQYPLMVFTTEGIYALSVNSEGLYASSYPMSREVCNNANSITPTGRLVFFTSEKGLMAISGNTAVCVSTQLSGPTPHHFNLIGDGDFRAFLKDCTLAYDYRESLIRIYSPTHTYHYVYNMLDQTFAKTLNENAEVLTVVSSYPDNLVQETDGKVYSMLDKPDINADQRTYSGTFITRPLKLGSSLELKTIRQILHFFNSNEGTMQLRIFGSNDCRTWRELKSIHGKPWLFYTFQYDFSNLRASDTFAGTVLAIETRFNDKMR